MLTFRQRRQQSSAQTLSNPTTSTTSHTQISTLKPFNRKLVLTNADSLPLSRLHKRTDKKIDNTNTSFRSNPNETNDNFGICLKKATSYKRKRINSNYSRVKRIHQAKDSANNNEYCENESESENDDDLTTDSVHSDYAESNEDKEASNDEFKTKTNR